MSEVLKCIFDESPRLFLLIKTLYQEDYNRLSPTKKVQLLGFIRDLAVVFPAFKEFNLRSGQNIESFVTCLDSAGVSVSNDNAMLLAQIQSKFYCLINEQKFLCEQKSSPPIVQDNQEDNQEEKHSPSLARRKTFFIDNPSNGQVYELMSSDPNFTQVLKTMTLETMAKLPHPWISPRE